MQGHFPATKIDHACAALAMRFVKDSFLHWFNPLKEVVEVDSRNEKRVNSDRVHPPVHVPERLSAKTPGRAAPSVGASPQARAALQSSVHERFICLSVSGWIAPSAAASPLSPIRRATIAWWRRKWQATIRRGNVQAAGRIEVAHCGGRGTAHDDLHAPARCRKILHCPGPRFRKSCANGYKL